MASVVINRWGTKRYLNEHGMLHREDGPARIYRNGKCEYYRNNSYYGARYPSGNIRMFDDDKAHLQSKNPNGKRTTYGESGGSIWPKLK